MELIGGPKERVSTGAQRGAIVGAIVGLLGFGFFPPPPGIRAPEFMLWFLRFEVGAAIGGGLAGALVGRLLPAMRDGLVALITGSVAVGIFLMVVQVVSVGLIGVTVERAVGLLGISAALGSAIGLFTRAIVRHEKPGIGEAPARSHVVLWGALELLRPRRRGWLGRKPKRRDQLRSQSLPESWRLCLEKNVPYYGMLLPEDRQELEKQIQVFVAEKNFEGCGGLTLTDEVRVTIAAQACLLTLHLDADYYPKLRSILVYPSTFVPKRPSLRPYWQDSDSDTAATLGESWRSGIVILSWDSVLSGAANVEDGRNVVFHEFAHQLDQESGAGAGVPILNPPSSYRTWARVLQQHFEEHAAATERGSSTVLDPYGAKNPAEFFAVATEAFFEKPGQLKARHHELYEELRAYYGQDPVGSAAT